MSENSNQSDVGSIWVQSHAGSNMVLDFPDQGYWSGNPGVTERESILPNAPYLEIFGDRVYFKGEPRPSDQILSEAGAYWDETAFCYYLFIEQTATLVKLAKPYADIRMPIYGSLRPGTFFTFDAMEGLVVKVDSEKDEAYLITVHHRA